ncbi:MAG: serine O-acetyltransferase EpsC [Bacilli bacterium]
MGLVLRKHDAAKFIKLNEELLFRDLLNKKLKIKIFEKIHIARIKEILRITGANKDTIRYFLNETKKLKNILVADAEFAYQCDPASEGIEEIILTYPGFFAIFCYRIAHILKKVNVRLLPRMITEIAHTNTGIDIHPGATIGHPFFIDHGTGIVIGETSVVGNFVKMYQGVTLGALSLKEGQSLKNTKRHPTVGNNVTLYANAVLLGGNTIIGDNVTIGGNAFVRESVPDNKVVYFKSDVITK